MLAMFIFKKQMCINCLTKKLVKKKKTNLKLKEWHKGKRGRDRKKRREAERKKGGTQGPALLSGVSLDAELRQPKGGVQKQWKRFAANPKGQRS